MISANNPPKDHGRGWEVPAGGIMVTSAKGYLPAPVVRQTFVCRRRSLCQRPTSKPMNRLEVVLWQTWLAGRVNRARQPGIDRTTIDTFLFPLGKGKVLPHRRIDLVDRLSVCKVRTQEAENFDEEVKS